METYNATTQKFEKEKLNSFPMAKIYGYLSLGLLVTGGVAFGLPYLLAALNIMGAWMPLMIVSMLVMFPMMFVIQIKAFNPNSKAVPICYFVYAVAMGVSLSTIFLAFDIQDVFLAFLISGGTFGLLAAVGYFTKKSLNGLLPIVFTAVIGSLIISLINFFFFNETIYWITEFVMFGAILLITAIDMNNIKRIALSRGVEKNLAIYCAFNLYVDFIYIFVRILMFIGMMRSNN